MPIIISGTHRPSQPRNYRLIILPVKLCNKVYRHVIVRHHGGGPTVTIGRSQSEITVDNNRPLQERADSGQAEETTTTEVLGSDYEHD